jgi:integrase
VAVAAGNIEDRWLTKKRDPETGKRERTARYGKGKRYRVKQIPNVRDRSFDSLEDAKAWLKRSTTDVERGEFYDPRNGNITLQEYVEKTWWPALRMPPTTKASMRYRVFGHILPLAGHLRLSQIGPDEIKLWLTQVEQRIDVSTARVTWRHFSSIMQAAFKANKVPANPFRDDDLKAPAPPKSKAKAWPLETVAKVRGELDGRYRVLVDLALGAGLRQGECFGFSPDDVDGEVLQVTRQIVKVGSQLAFAPPKGNKEREAPCPPELAELIKGHMREFGTVDVTLPWVDPDRPNLAWESRPTRTVRLLVTTARTGGKAGGAINRSTFDDIQWKPALMRAGVILPPKKETMRPPGKKPWTRTIWGMPREDGFHVLRHTFASVVLAGGETITKLADWLGHADPAFTLRTYVHFMPRAGERGIEALAAMFQAVRDAPVVPDSPDTPQAEV